MKLWPGALVAVVCLLAACRSAHDVAETSYQTATAPNNIVSPRTGRTATTVTTTNTTTIAPQPIASSSQNAPPAPSSENTTSTYTEQRGSASAESKPKPSSTQDFPTAKPVEGKPGYVYSPFDPSKYVDVSGYAPGSKVKDPYSGKIFLVP